MSRHVQVTFDAADPRALATFWRDVLGYVHPGPPGVTLSESADPLAAWDDFLQRIGVPKVREHSVRSRTPTGMGHDSSSSRWPRARCPRTGSTSTSVQLLDCMGMSGWPPWNGSVNVWWHSGRLDYAVTSPTRR